MTLAILNKYVGEITLIGGQMSIAVLETSMSLARSHCSSNGD